MIATRDFAAHLESIPAARSFVLRAVADAPRDVRDAVSVMVSELAMNAVQWARSSFSVSVRAGEGTLRVEVTDASPARPAAQPVPLPSDLHGRGLVIVGKLSDAWGVTPSPHGTGKTVWFSLATTSRPSAPAR